MYMFRHAIICKDIHLGHMETSDNVVCKDGMLSDTNYSYFNDVLSFESKKTDLEVAKEAILLIKQKLQKRILYFVVLK